jgi:hypothetical protein
LVRLNRNGSKLCRGRVLGVPGAIDPFSDEAIKLIVGSATLTGRLFYFDALKMAASLRFAATLFVRFWGLPRHH